MLITTALEVQETVPHMSHELLKRATLPNIALPATESLEPDANFPETDMMVPEVIGPETDIGPASNISPETEDVEPTVIVPRTFTEPLV